MNILVCPDKFKGSLSAREVCEAIERGIRMSRPGARIESMPLADGGEGTCAILTEWSGGDSIAIQVHGPLFEPVTARYGISGQGDTAFIEMAEASGLTLLKPQDRNPLYTTSFGTGELIVDALKRGVKHIVLGIGGSATNDAGIGMASALGYDFCDSAGEVLKPTGENLIHIRSVRSERLHSGLGSVEVTALCDVTNPLHGPDGAAYVYGPQKGASKSAIEFLDAGLRNFRRIVHKQLKTSVDFPGAGAAGGLGAGARAFLGATIQKGVTYIIEHGGLADKIMEADIVVTGEGKIDTQTFSGKVVSEIIRLSAKARKPVYAFCGVCEIAEDDTRASGITKLISLVDKTTSAESAVRNARDLIVQKTSAAFLDHPDR